MGPHLSNLCSLSGVLQVSVNAPLLVCFAFLHFEAKFLSVFSWDMSVKNLEKKVNTCPSEHKCVFQFLGQVSIKSQNELQPENVMSRKKCHLKIHTARHRTEICGHVILCYTTQRRTSNDIYTKKHTQNGSHELKMPSFPARNMLWKDCDGKSTPTLSSPLHKPSQPSQPSQP